MIDVGTQRVYIELSTEPCLKITGTIKSSLRGLQVLHSK